MAHEADDDETLRTEETEPRPRPEERR